MPILLLVGRCLFAAIFLMTFFSHFKAEAVGYAKSVGLPAASFLVPASGVLAGLGALSIIVGYDARIGAALIALFLVPVTFTMHKFWAIKDNPMMARMQQTMFMKNISMLGAALLIMYFGSGPLSLN